MKCQPTGKLLFEDEGKYGAMAGINCEVGWK